MKTAICWLILILICSACQKSEKYYYRKYIIGATCEITFYSKNDSLAHEILTECDEELSRLHALLNRFSDSSLVSILNREQRIAAPLDIITLVELCDSISRLTNGLFDISIAQYMELWGFYEHNHHIPDKQLIQQAAQHVGYQDIIVIKDSIFIESGMQLDFGGIAQGYAADRIALILRKYAITSALINIGGEVVTIGRSPENRPWRIGIKHPREKGIIETMEIENQALSTSGDYEKYFIVNGKRYPHIIDPRIGYPAKHFASVTIIHTSAAFADAIATAVAIMGPEQGMKFLDSLGFQGIIYYEDKGVLQRVERK